MLLVHSMSFNTYSDLPNTYDRYKICCTIIQQVRVSNCISRVVAIFQKEFNNYTKLNKYISRIKE